MDIKNINQSLVSSRLNESNTSSPNKSAGAQNAPSLNVSADKVTLTQTSTQVMNLEKKAAASEVDNSAKIEALKEAIKDGSYQVNAEKVASKLIETEVLMAGQ